jgi:uncharacterized protein YhaN
MKLLRLDLRAFGPFTDVTLDLSAGQEGLHVLYGPNEAGKSSALRALRQLFFGIPERCTDGFMHPNKNLRIGAKVRHCDGTTLEVVRRKARSNDLRGTDDNSIVEPEKLQRFLGGVDKDRFETMFSIDHADLVKGGEEIVGVGGKFGELLFAASSGLSGLGHVQEALGQDMKELFLPGGANPRINKLVQEYTDVKRDLKDRQLSHEEWSRHRKASDEASVKKQTLEKEVQEKGREVSRLKRFSNALKAIAARRQIVRDLEVYQECIVLRDDFSEEHRQVDSDLRLADAATEDAKKARSEIENQLKQIQVPELLLDQAARVEDLYRRLGAHQKNLEDRPTREIQKKTHEHEAKQILQSLGRPPELAQAELLRLSLDETLKLQNLGTKYQGLVANRDNAQKNIETQKERIAEVQKKLEQFPTPPDTTELQRELQRALKLGEPENDLITMQNSLAAAEQRASLDLSRMPHWTGSLDALEKLPALSDETIQEFEDAKADFTKRETRLDQRRQDSVAKLHSVDEHIHRLQLEQEVPTEENLKTARQKRAIGWGLVRRAWLEKLEDGSPVKEFISDMGAGRSLAEAYEQSVHKADDVVDRLRREADRVAQNANLSSQREALRLQLDELTKQQQQWDHEFESKKQEWLGVLQSRGMPPLRLTEVRGWIQARSDLIAKAGVIRDQREQIAQVIQTVTTTSNRLLACLTTLGEPPFPSDRGHSTLLEHCQETVRRLDSVKSTRTRLKENLEGHERDLRTAQSDATKADEQLAAWQTQWTPLTARIGLGSGALPETANAYLASITELFKRLNEADVLRRRIEGMDRDTGKFTEDARALAIQIAPDQTDRTAEEIAVELQARLTRARTAFQNRKNLTERHEKESEKLREAEQNLGNTKIRLGALCKEAGCQTTDGLAQAEERSRTRKDLEKELHKIEEQIRQFSAGATVEEMVAEADKIDADSLDSDIASLEERLSALRQDISQVDQTIGGERIELALMNGNESAADAAEKAESLLAELQTEVPQYVTLRLASVVLQRAVERYREKNQGPVLERANRLFAALTLGSFAGLRISYDEPEPVLEGVRPDGTSVGVAGMSDGSCDQLYLALRLATLELWLESHEPVPFIVDDVLLQFDDERATAALKVLAELSRRTQVIFFTHHQHLVQLAKKQLDGADTIYHHLPGRPA